MIAAKELSQDVGVWQACAAFGVARATFYRQRAGRTLPQAGLPRKTPAPRALSSAERDAVRTLLSSERYQDQIGRAHV